MLNIILCEIKKLKNSKMVFLSVLGALATPAMMICEALQTHFEHPEQFFTIGDLYQNSMLYSMLLTNMMVYVTIAAFIFSREYGERTLKTVLPIPVSRKKLVAGKFLTLLVWMIILSIISWGGLLFLSVLYFHIFEHGGGNIGESWEWLGKMMVGSVLMFLTVTPYTYLAEKTKGLVTPMIVSAIMVMGSAALCNQKIGALYPWTATYFLVIGKNTNTGYSNGLMTVIILLVSMLGLAGTFCYFEKEDIR